MRILDESDSYDQPRPADAIAGRFLHAREKHPLRPAPSCG